MWARICPGVLIVASVLKSAKWSVDATHRLAAPVRQRGERVPQHLARGAARRLVLRHRRSSSSDPVPSRNGVPRGPAARRAWRSSRPRPSAPPASAARPRPRPCRGAASAGRAGAAAAPRPRRPAASPPWPARRGPGPWRPRDASRSRAGPRGRRAGVFTRGSIPTASGCARTRPSDRQPHRVRPRHHPRPARLARRVEGDRRHRVAERRGRRRLVPQVPDETVEAGLGRQLLRRADPVVGDVAALDRRLGPVVARVPAHEAALRVEHLERDVLRVGLQVVVDRRAVRRVRRRGLVRRQGRVGVLVPANAQRRSPERTGAPRPRGRPAPPAAAA